MESILDSLITNLQQAKLALQSNIIQQELRARLHADNDSDPLPDPILLQKSLEVINLSHEITTLLEPSDLILSDHFFGYVKPKSLLTAVRLKIPDLLSQHGPQTLSSLSNLSSSKPLPLRQILRLLSSSGIFTYDSQTDTFSNNRVSEHLLSHRWAALWTEMYAGKFYDFARGMPESIRRDSTRNALQIEMGTDEDVYSVFAKRGWVPEFHRALTAAGAAQAKGVLKDYPWEEVGDEEVMDIGGGAGGLIALLLRGFPRMRRGVFDLPGTVDESRRAFHGEGGEFEDVGERVRPERLIEGNFLEWIPPAKVYTMKWVMHNWGHEDGLKILKNIRAAIVEESGARLVVLDCVLGYGHADCLSRYADITMMMSIDALERTREEWNDMATQAGWKIHSVRVMRNAWPCAIDMRPIQRPVLGSLTEHASLV